MKQSVAILGSTGSIGCSTLAVIKNNMQDYSVTLLTGNTNVDLMLTQCLEFRPKLAIMRNERAADKLRTLLQQKNSDIEVKFGEQAIVDAANFPKLTTVVAAIVGAAGLLPTLTAVKNGLKVLLANKEALVMSGELFMQAVKQSGAVLLPVDSEHNAIFQCLPDVDQSAHSEMQGVSKILLTGSGGPFRQLDLASFAKVTPEQACKHPNWTMGKKISVDSATMMNKGLELIEACFLFAITLEKIDIVVHPQSIVHSMVSYKDGSVLAQMGNPDMRTPIAHALAWPKRINSGVAPLDFYSILDFTFEAPDFKRFPCLKLASEAMRNGGTAPCILNAANEVAVAAFLDKTILFSEIPLVIEQTLAKIKYQPADDLSLIIAVDEQARKVAIKIINDGVNQP